MNKNNRDICAKTVHKRIFKYWLIATFIICTLFIFTITANAVPVSRAGDLPSTTEQGSVKVDNAAGNDEVLDFHGKLVGDYRINGNTAVCNYSAMDGLAGFNGNTTKYILGNSTARAKIMYYLTPLRAKCTPSGFYNYLPDSIKGKSFAWLYKQLGYYNYPTPYSEMNQINTYSDVVIASIFYFDKNMVSARNQINQYVVIHCLHDYVQHGMFTDPSEKYVAENAAFLLYEFITKYESIIPSLPDSVRAFIVNPYPNQETQTLISIEYYKGYFQINKKSRNPKLTSGNNYYSLNGAEYSWYKTKAAATNAANAVARGESVPKGDEYIGYSKTDSNGVSTTIYPKGSSTPVDGYVFGTYYLVETKAPMGFVLDSTVRTLTISTTNIFTSRRAIINCSEYPLYGSITLSKVSANKELTEGNSLYTLAGAEYTVYTGSDPAHIDFFSKITTNSDGKAYLYDIPLGKYYIKETKAPNGYQLDNLIHQIEVTSTVRDVSLRSNEPALYNAEPTLISKRDAKSSNPLKGAKFIVEYYNQGFDEQTYRTDFTPTKRWLFETDNDGLIKLDSDHLVTEYTDEKGNKVQFTNDSFYYSPADSSIAILPQGTLRMYEVEPPIVQDANGNKYKYKLDDTPTIRNVLDHGNGTVEYQTVTLYNEIEGALTTTINGEKIWDDNDNANGNRPDEVTISLVKRVNGQSETVATTTTNAENNWKYQFNDLPITEVINGIPYPISYTALEVEIPPGYSRTVRGMDVINHERSTKVSVTKVWDDNNNQDGVRPSNITVRLYADSVYTGKYAVLSGENNWTYTFEKLPFMKNKVKVNYSVAEYFDDTDGSDDSNESEYTSIITPTGNGSFGYTFTITNTHVPEKTSVVVKKKWNDTSDLDNIRPNNIKVKLKGYVNDTVVYESDNVSMTSYGNATDDEDVWSYTFEDLDKYFEGDLIDYVATEATIIDGYNLDEEGNPQTVTAPLTIQEDGTYACVLENTHILRKTSINVLKEWDDDDNRDGLRPNSITVYLATVDQNGDKHRYIDENGDEVAGVLQESNDWKYQFSNIPIYDSNRELITYAVEEVVPYGYSVSYRGHYSNGIVITNTHHESTSVTVNKVWDDNNDQDGIRPDTVKINLLADGEKINDIELNESNGWAYTFENLPVHQNGKEIKYTVSEDDISIPAEYTESGYTTRIGRKGDAQSGYTFTVTNVHTPSKRTINVNKVWNDSNNHDGIRPNQVEVILSVISPANTGIEPKRGFLSDENNWQYTFQNLPKYYNGALIVYDVDETDIVIDVNSNGYTKRKTGNMENGFTFTNTHQNERIRLIINKVWDDYDNAANMRPSTATFEITGYQGQVSTVTLSESNNWQYIQTYNKYYNGEVQEPDVKEINLPEGYVGRKVVTVNRATNSRITTYQYTWTNTFEPDPTSIQVKKIWNDSQDYFGQRPEGIIVDLFVRDAGTNGSGSPRGSLSLSDENDWEGTFGGMFPRYINGVEQEYFVKEYSAHFTEEYDEYVEPTGNMILEKDSDQSAFERHYIQKIEGNSVDGFTITNTHEYFRNTNIPFKKIWNDDSDRDRIRPGSLDIVLIGYIGSEDGYDFDNAIEVSRRYATVTAANNWQYTFRNLPALCSEAQAAPLVGEPEDYDQYSDYADALSIASVIWYKVEEINVPDGYEQTLSDNSWITDDSYEYQTNFSVMYYIYHMKENVPYGNKPISFGLLNKHTPATTSVKVNKKWLDANNQDGVRPSSITINLLANGIKIDDVQLNSSNGWSHSFTGLNVYDNGQPITYSVSEEAFETPTGFDNYELVSVDEIGNTEDGWSYTFTNKYNPQTTHLSVVKRWQDNNDRLGKRAKRLLIVLRADGVAIKSYALTQADADTNSANWRYTFDNLPKYKNGVEIQYSAEEQPDNATKRLYKNTMTRTTTDSSGYKTVTFTNKVKTATISIEKKNQYGGILEGAEFDLFLSDGTPLKLSQIYAGRYSYNPTLTTYVNRVVLSSGTAMIEGLPTDAIIIAREVTTPNTYFPFNNDIIIDVQQTIQDNELTESSSGVFTLPTITVNNYKTVMPATGGFGDYTFYILAGMFLIGAFIILKKRKDVDL
jgi:hypothetical protein